MLLLSCYAPNRAVLSPSPLFRDPSANSLLGFRKWSASPILVTTERPIAHLRRDLKLTNLVLGEGNGKQ